jgi:ureidoglycolate dehydrogenase (NAD+)/L-2-hydroxycarboxylate dehydrogenase (NAD+)
MPETTAKQVHDLATKALEGQGFKRAIASEIAEEFVIAELSGVRTHGLGKLVSLNIGSLKAKPRFTEHGGIIAVDGDKASGFVLFREIADKLIQKCAKHGIVAAFAHNHSRYSSLYPYTSRVARAGYVAILSNTAGPPAVAPYGSVDPLTGTNPICFSFPRPGGEAQTFDFATSDMVWGAIRQAALEGKPLPLGPFLNAAGEETSVPNDVNAVRSFGGHKGWALNLALEIAAGILAGGKVGNECDSEFDCGAFFIAIDPAATGVGLNKFSESLERLLASIRAARPEDPSDPVRVPGDRGRNSRSIARDGAATISVPDKVIEMMNRMAAGESVADLAANPLFN